MPLRLGGKSIKDVYLGDKKIAKIYLGDKLVYQSNKDFIIKVYKIAEGYLENEYVSVDTLENNYYEIEEYIAFIENNKVYAKLKGNEEDVYGEFYSKKGISVDHKKIIEASFNVGIRIAGYGTSVYIEDYAVKLKNDGMV